MCTSVRGRAQAVISETDLLAVGWLQKSFRLHPDPEAPAKEDPTVGGLGANQAVPTLQLDIDVIGQLDRCCIGTAPASGWLHCWDGSAPSEWALSARVALLIAKGQSRSRSCAMHRAETVESDRDAGAGVDIYREGRDRHVCPPPPTLQALQQPMHATDCTEAAPTPHARTAHPQVAAGLELLRMQLEEKQRRGVLTFEGKK